MKPPHSIRQPRPRTALVALPESLLTGLESSWSLKDAGHTLCTGRLIVGAWYERNDPRIRKPSSQPEPVQTGSVQSGSVQSGSVPSGSVGGLPGRPIQGRKV